MFQRYIASLLAKGDDYREYKGTFDTQILTMVQERRDDIERHSKAVVNIIVEKCEVCVYGRTKCVEEAQTLINRMVCGKQSELVENENRTRGGFCGGTKDEVDNVTNFNVSDERTQNQHDDSETERNIKDDCVPLLCSTGDRLSPIVPPMDIVTNSEGDSPSVCTKQGEEGVVCDSDLTETNSLVCDLEVQNLNKCLSSQSSCSGSSTLSNDESQEKDQSQPSIIQDKNKIEFALKLGYSQEQLAVVLKKLGPNAGKNEILSELISVSEDTSDSDSEEEWSPQHHLEPVDSENRTEFYSVDVLKEGEEELSNLRPIVIDGSNVAMRWEYIIINGYG